MTLPVGPWGWFQIACFGLALPWLAARSARQLPALSQRPRKQHFVSVIVVQLATALLSIKVALEEGITLFPAAWPPRAAMAAGLAFLVAAIVLLRPRWREAVARREPRAHFVMPRDGPERGLWVVVSVAAGLGEEISYRGVLFVLLWRLTSEPISAAIGAAFVFGAAHAVQGRGAMLIVGLIALLLQGLVALAGSLYVAMGVHVLYDLVAGLTYGRLGEELDYPAEGVPPEAPVVPG